MLCTLVKMMTTLDAPLRIIFWQNDEVIPTKQQACFGTCDNYCKAIVLKICFCIGGKHCLAGHRIVNVYKRTCEPAAASSHPLCRPPYMDDADERHCCLLFCNRLPRGYYLVSVVIQLKGYGYLELQPKP